MTLATHTLVAGATARLLSITNPVAALLVGLASHYGIDAIPHYDYPLRSARQERSEKLEFTLTPSKKNLLRDLLAVGVDSVLGVLLLVALTPKSLDGTHLITTLALILGAILPDALQAAFFVYQKSPLLETKLLHDFFHAKHRLTKDWLGIGSQALIVLLAVLVLARFHP